MIDLPKNPSDVNWQEWTLKQLRAMGKECEELDQKAAMLDYTANVFNKIGVKNISFGEEGPTLDTENKILRFPIEKVRGQDDEEDTDSSR